MVIGCECFSEPSSSPVLCLNVNILASDGLRVRLAGLTEPVETTVLGVDLEVPKPNPLKLICRDSQPAGLAGGLPPTELELLVGRDSVASKALLEIRVPRV